MFVSDEGIEDGGDLLLGDGSHEAVHHFSALEEKERRDVADAELHGSFIGIVDVALGHDHATFVFGLDLVHGGGEHAAGAAPGSPEINHHGQVTCQDVGNVGIGYYFCHSISY